MKKELKTIVRLNKIVRLNNSSYGNPRYAVYFEDRGNEEFYGKTESNGSIGYKISTRYEGMIAMIKYHRTKTGNIIITDINDRELEEVFSKRRKEIYSKKEFTRKVINEIVRNYGYGMAEYIYERTTHEEYINLYIRGSYSDNCNEYIYIDRICVTADSEEGMITDLYKYLKH